MQNIGQHKKIKQVDVSSASHLSERTEELWVVCGE